MSEMEKIIVKKGNESKSDAMNFTSKSDRLMNYSACFFLIYYKANGEWHIQQQDDNENNNSKKNPPHRYPPATYHYSSARNKIQNRILYVMTIMK